MELRLTKYDKNCQRIEDEDGVVHYMALALTNGRWSLVDRDDRRVTAKTFQDPNDAYEEAKAIQAAREATAASDGAPRP